MKDRLSRKILDRFDQEKIGIASGTYAVVEFPPLRFEGPAVGRIAGALEHPQVPEARRRSA